MTLTEFPIRHLSIPFDMNQSFLITCLPSSPKDPHDLQIQHSFLTNLSFIKHIDWFSGRSILIILSQIQLQMNTTKNVPDYDHIQNGVTWIGGTTHELQKQHIPGYSGHVKGLFAENVYGKNFARVTAECLNERHTKGIDIDRDQKYRTTYKNEYQQPDQRRNKFITAAENVLGRLDEAEKNINYNILEQYKKQPKSIAEIPPIDRLPIPGYMGHKPVFRPPIKQVKPVEQPRNIQLEERKILETMLQTGDFDKKTFQQITKQEPVVGYGGFLKGVKAQNQYGVSYRELAKKSIQG